MRDDTLQMWTSNTLRQMAEGKGLPEILSQFDGMVEKRRGHAKMVARTQIATFNCLTSKARAQNLGITKARWVTSADERVRPATLAVTAKSLFCQKVFMIQETARRYCLAPTTSAAATMS